MTLRKITIDKSVRYIPKSEQTKEREIKPKSKTIKAGSNKTKTVQKIIKNSFKTQQQVDLEYLQNSIYLYKNNRI